MRKFVTCFVILFSSCSASLAQNTLVQTRYSDSLRLLVPENWKTADLGNLKADDAVYIESKPINYPKGLGAVLFFKFGFSIPNEATIQKIDVTVIRKKMGRTM